MSAILPNYDGFTQENAYRAGLIRSNPADRKRLNPAEVTQLERQIYEVLKSSHPQSVRHAYYAMTNPRLPVWVPKGRVRNADGKLSKNEPGYDCIQNRCVQMRRSGAIPYNWFADLSRTGFFTPTYHDAADFLETHIGAYRADLWKDSAYRCEVWVESRSLAASIMADCKELAVALYPAGGYTSLTFASKSAEDNNAVFNYDQRPLVILYIGDLDPHGIQIDRALETELRKHLNPSMEMFFRRIAITEEQVVEYDLPDKGEGERKVEGEAMPANILRQILRTEIESLLPTNALKVSKVAEDSERAWLKTMATMRRDKS
jgi:hypothetical protein